MKAISTIQLILQYKQKYSPIGQATNNQVDLIELLRKHFGTDGSTFLNNMTKAFKDLDLEVANVNVGLSKLTKTQSDLDAATVKTVAEMTLLESREAGLTSTFKTGTEELALRSKAYSSLQSSIKATSSEMAGYRAILEKTSELSGKLFATEVKLGTTKKKNKDGSEYEEDVKGINTYIQRQLVANQYLARNTSLSDDNAASLSLYAAGAGRSLDEQVTATEELAKAYDGVISKSTSFEIISQEIANMSSDMRQQYSRIPGNLEVAVLKSKQLGVSMAQLSKTGESLLDIESSVGKEIEYQLLSGKRLVDQQGKSITNQYREATLTGDAVKQADLLKEVYESQKEVLSGSNILAKKALADSLGMSTQDLMNMYEKQKVQEKISEAYKKDKDNKTVDIDELLNDPAKMKEFKLSLEKSTTKTDKELLTAIQTLEKDADTRMSPAQKIEKQLQSIIDTGLNVHITKDSLKKAREEAVGGGKNKKGKDKKGYVQIVQEGTKFQKEPALAEAVGDNQIKREYADAVTTSGKEVSKAAPIVAGAVNEAANSIEKAVEKVYGEKMQGQVPVTGVGDNNNTPVKSASDAVIGVNDGVIKFNDKDKLTVVASPFGTMNEKVADKITNPTSGGSSMDMNTIVAAIQKALGNINITVALDPMAIDKEIKFRQGSLNS